MCILAEECRRGHLASVDIYQNVRNAELLVVRRSDDETTCVPVLCGSGRMSIDAFFFFSLIENRCEPRRPYHFRGAEPVVHAGGTFRQIAGHARYGLVTSKKKIFLFLFFKIRHVVIITAYLKMEIATISHIFLPFSLLSKCLKTLTLFFYITLLSSLCITI